jgi:uncharacterized protein YndB with AHSA1/START domain
MHIEHELIINAPVSTVWDLTTDVESWPALSPTTITTVERLDTGPIRPGSQARVKQPAQRPTVWTVRTADENHLFVWDATVWGMHMVATHTLEAVEGGCRNRLAIDVTGRGARLFARVVGRKIADVIATENAGFKQHAEAVKMV